MATSGTFYVSIPGGHRLKVSWQQGSQYGMETQISGTVTWASIGTNWTAGYYYLTVNGYDYSSRRYYLNATGGTNAPTISFSKAVVRDNATNKGTLSISLRAEGDVQGEVVGSDEMYEEYTVSNSGSWTIETVTKYGTGAKLSSVDWENDEANPVIHFEYDKGSSVDEATLQACISFTGATDNIPYRVIENTGSYTFPLTQDERKTLWTLLQDGETATVRFYIKTTEVVNYEVMHIENYVSKTVTFVNYKPVPKPTIVDVNPATIALTGGTSPDGYPILVRYMSKAQYNMNVELRKGALDVIGCYVQNGGKIEEGFVEGTFDYPESNTFYFSATDNRGYTGTTMYSLNSFDGEFIEYVKLTAGIKSEPISGEGVLQFTVTGKYFDKYFSATNKNEMSIRYAVYPQNGTATWVDLGVITPTVDGSDYSYSITVNSLDYTKAHTIEVQVIDKLLTATATITAVAKPVFYWNKDNFFFNVPVSINDGVVDYIEEQNTASAYYMNSSGQYSSAGLSWNYIKWASGLLECWCTVPVTATINTSWGNMYVAAAQYKTDLSYPVQPKETPLVLVTLGAGGTKGMLIADNSYAADNVSTGRYNIASPVAITSSTTFRLNYYVRGKWK